MDAFHSAVEAGTLANSKLEELDKLKNIWDRIVIGEYITYSGKTVHTETPGMISSDIVDCYSKHPFKNKFINNQAKETYASALLKERQAAAASHCEEMQQLSTQMMFHNCLVLFMFSFDFMLLQKSCALTFSDDSKSQCTSTF